MTRLIDTALMADHARSQKKPLLALALILSLLGLAGCQIYEAAEASPHLAGREVLIVRPFRAIGPETPYLAAVKALLDAEWGDDAHKLNLEPTPDGKLLLAWSGEPDELEHRIQAIVMLERGPESFLIYSMGLPAPSISTSEYVLISGWDPSHEVVALRHGTSGVSPVQLPPEVTWIRISDNGRWVGGSGDENSFLLTGWLMGDGLGPQERVPLGGGRSMYLYSWAGTWSRDGQYLSLPTHLVDLNTKEAYLSPFNGDAIGSVGAQGLLVRTGRYADQYTVWKKAPSRWARRLPAGDVRSGDKLWRVSPSGLFVLGRARGPWWWYAAGGWGPFVVRSLTTQVTPPKLKGELGRHERVVGWIVIPEPAEPRPPSAGAPSE